MFRRIAFTALLGALFLAALTGCAPQKSSTSGAATTGGAAAMDMSGLKMAPLSQMSAEVQQAPASVQAAYRFNVANPAIMQHIPCYCGCGAVGHKSNYDCYVTSDQGGTITFDQHALGCGICVDITRDAMRMTGQGKSPQAIKAYVDQTYSQYGPSNMQ